jgi:hypothetical protein
MVALAPLPIMVMSFSIMQLKCIEAAYYSLVGFIHMQL